MNSFLSHNLSWKYKVYTMHKVALENVSSWQRLNLFLCSKLFFGIKKSEFIFCIGNLITLKYSKQLSNIQMDIQ